MDKPTINSASVRVMHSYNYCHFEVCLSSSDADTPEKVNELRKDAARLADKAVNQYKAAKAAEESVDLLSAKWRLEQARRTPEGERTPEEKAIIKYAEDAAFRNRFAYDYQEDYDAWDEDKEY
jgi:hypothetical protein